MRTKNQQKKRKRKPFANKIQNYEMNINNNKKNLNEKTVVYHKSASDRGVLAMMCGRDEEPRPIVATHLKIIMACTRCRVMDTCC